MQPKVLSAEGVSDGVIVQFDDGRCALYPASLLHESFGKAKEVINFGAQPEEE